MFMTPPRSDSDGAIAIDREGAVLGRIAELQGIVNVANGELVGLVREAIDEGWAGSGGNLTPDAWVALRAGITPGQAASIVRVARRSHELPHTVAALQAGGLTVDQAGEIARHVPTAYEASAARVASCCTVTQLRTTLPHYADPKPDGSRRQRRQISTGYDDEGWWIRGRLPESEGAKVDQALKAMREDLDRHDAAATLEGERAHRASLADALVAQAETVLQVGEAARPGTDRYLVHVHLHQGLSGPELMTHLGVALPDGERRLLLCEARLRATLHEGATPVAMGRATHIVNRRLRRLIEHRDGGCAVPGCTRTHDLQIHHIWHWEDGGPTESWNLLALCGFHHARHHHSLLGIVGNADLPRHTEPGVVFSDPHGRPLDPAGTPVRPAAGHTPEQATRAAGLPQPDFLPPTGERIDRWGFHLTEEAPAPPPPDDDTDVDATSPPTWERDSSGSTPSTLQARATDPTRAGPTT